VAWIGAWPSETWIASSAGHQGRKYRLRFEELGKLSSRCVLTGPQRPQRLAGLRLSLRPGVRALTQFRATASAQFQSSSRCARLRLTNSSSNGSRTITPDSTITREQPLMVHHIPGSWPPGWRQPIAAHRLRPVRSGNYQWLTLRRAQGGGLRAPVEEFALFCLDSHGDAHLRQAAFAGKIPRFLLRTPSCAPTARSPLASVLGDRGLSPSQVGFVSIPGDSTTDGGEDSCPPRSVFWSNHLHGGQNHAWDAARAVAGPPGPHLGGRRFPLPSCRASGSRGFDGSSPRHGNSVAFGIGRPQEGVLSDNAASACRIYSDPTIRKGCSTYSQAPAWIMRDSRKTFARCCPPYGNAFTQDGTTLLCHDSGRRWKSRCPLLPIPAHTVRPPCAPKSKSLFAGRFAPFG